jgi:hypothetical protein
LTNRLADTIQEYVVVNEHTVVRVYLIPKIPQRPPCAEDVVYLCYDDESPTPWEKKLFSVQDEQGRFWFCHELKGTSLTKESLQRLAKFIQDEHTPKSEQALQRRIKNPLTVQAVVSRASSLDELCSLLSLVKSKRPTREEA